MQLEMYQLLRMYDLPLALCATRYLELASVVSFHVRYLFLRYHSLHPERTRRSEHWFNGPVMMSHLNAQQFLPLRLQKISVECGGSFEKVKLWPLAFACCTQRSMLSL